ARGHRRPPHRQWRRGPPRALPARGRRGRRRGARRQRVPLRLAHGLRGEGDAASRRTRGPVTTTTQTLDSLGGGGTDRLTRRGFAVMGRGIVRQRLMFTWAALASLLFGVMTVADAWVLGWATDHVITPSFEAGEITGSTLGTGV